MQTRKRMLSVFWLENIGLGDTGLSKVGQRDQSLVKSFTNISMDRDFTFRLNERYQQRRVFRQDKVESD